MKSDESAFSIVPSRLSSRFSGSTSHTSRPGSTVSDTNLEYHPLSFDDDLFTARVYKRNYRTNYHNIIKNGTLQIASRLSTLGQPITKAEK